MSSDTREKFRAVFLAAVMVLSVVAMSGSAAALQSVGNTGEDILISQENPYENQVNEVNLTVQAGTDVSYNGGSLKGIGINLANIQGSGTPGGDFDLSANPSNVEVYLAGSKLSASEYSLDSGDADSINTNVGVTYTDDSTFQLSASSDTILAIDLTPSNSQTLAENENVTVELSGVTNPGSSQTIAMGLASNNADGSTDDASAVSASTNTLSLNTPTEPSIAGSNGGSTTDIETSNGGTSQDITFELDTGNFGFHLANYDNAPTYSGDDAIDVAYDLTQLDSATTESNSGSDVSASISIDSVTGTNIGTGDFTSPGTNDASKTKSIAVDTTGISSFDTSRNVTDLKATLTLSGINTLNSNPSSGLTYQAGAAYSTSSPTSPGTTTDGPNTESFDLIEPLAEPLPGDSSANGDVSTSIQVDGSANETQPVAAGSGAQALGLIKIRDNSGGNSPFAARTLVDAPDGVTFNASASDSLLVTATSGELSVTNFEIKNDGQRLRIEHSGSSEDGQTIRISGLHIDVASDISAAPGGTRNTLTVDTATENFDTELLTVYKPLVEYSGDAVSAGGTGTSISSVDITPQNTDRQIANGSDIVVTLPESSGLSFDTSLTGSDIISSPNADTDSDDEVNTSGVTVNEQELQIPVIDPFEPDETLNLDGLQVNATGDASADTFSVNVTPATATGTVSADTSGISDITIDKPVIESDSNNDIAVTVGGDGQLLDNDENSIITNGENEQIDIRFQGSSQIAEDEYVNITFNSSAIEFDTLNTDSTKSLVGGGVDNIDADDDVTVTREKIALQSTGGSTSSNIELANSVFVNVSDSVEAGDRFQLNLDTSANVSDDTEDEFVIQAYKPDVANSPANNIAIGQATGPDATDGTNDIQIKSQVAGDLLTKDTGSLTISPNSSDVSFDASQYSTQQQIDDALAISSGDYGSFEPEDVSVTDAGALEVNITQGFVMAVDDSSGPGNPADLSFANGSLIAVDDDGTADNTETIPLIATERASGTGTSLDVIGETTTQLDDNDQVGNLTISSTSSSSAKVDGSQTVPADGQFDLSYDDGGGSSTDPSISNGQIVIIDSDDDNDISTGEQTFLIADEGSSNAKSLQVVGEPGASISDDAGVLTLSTDISSDTTFNQVNSVTKNGAETPSVDADAGDQIDVAEVYLNVTDDEGLEGDKVNFSVTTTPGLNKTVTTGSGTSDLLTTEAPDSTFNGGTDKTFYVDNDGEDAVALGADIVITSDADADIAADSFVNVTLDPDAEIEFDDATVGAGDIQAQSDGSHFDDDEDAALLNTTRVAFQEDASAASSDGDKLTIDNTGDQLKLNISSAAEGNYTFNVNTQPAGGADITKTASGNVTVEQATADTIFGSSDLSIDEDDENNGIERRSEGDGSYGSSSSDEADSSLTIDETANGSVYVDNSTWSQSGFGEAEVSLEIVSAPDGATGQSLNTTNPVITDNRGVADFEFTPGSETGPYVVNATTNTGDGVNMTYNVGAGSAAQVNVTKVTDAIAGESVNLASDPIGQDEALYQIRVEDEGGNLITNTNGAEQADVDVGFVFGGDAKLGAAYEDVDAALTPTAAQYGTILDGNGNSVDVFDDSDGDGRLDYDSSNDDTQTGEFYVSLTDSTEESVELTVSPEASAIAEDSAESTFFKVRGVNVSLNRSETTTFESSPTGVTITPVDDTDPANADDVTVQNITTSLSLSDDSVGTIATSGAETNLNGEVTTTVTADGAGTTDVEAIIRNTQGTAALTVQDPSYEISDSSLTPADVDENSTVEHKLQYTVAGASQDDSADTHTITLPNTTSITDETVNSVTDANGADIELSSGPTVSDANGGTNNQLTFDISPNSSFGTSAVDVDANITVDIPEVSADTTEDVDISVADSNSGQTSTTTSLTIQNTLESVALNLTANETTVTEDDPAYFSLKQPRSVADRAVQTGRKRLFTEYSQSGSPTSLPHNVYSYTRTHTGGLR